MKNKWLVSFTAQKMNLSLRTSSENVTKSEKKKNCGFGHIYWRKYFPTNTPR